MRLLEVDPFFRPKFEDILKHPWVADLDARKVTSDDFFSKSLDCLKSTKLNSNGQSNPDLANSIEKDESSKCKKTIFKTQECSHNEQLYLPSLPLSHSTSKLNSDGDNLLDANCEDQKKQTIQEQNKFDCYEQKQKHQSLKKQKLNDEVLVFKETFESNSINDNAKPKSQKINEFTKPNNNRKKNFNPLEPYNNRWREEQVLKYDEFSDSDIDFLRSSEIFNNETNSVFESNNFECEIPCSSNSLNEKNKTYSPSFYFNIDSSFTANKIDPKMDKNNASTLNSNFNESSCLKEEKETTLKPNDSIYIKDSNGNKRLPSSVLFEGIYKFLIVFY